jgi:hypothetical protein
VRRTGSDQSAKKGGSNGTHVGIQDAAGAA